MPPITPAIRFPTPHTRHTVAGVTRRARGPNDRRATSVTATTALPKVSGSWGMTRSTKAEPNAVAGGNPNDGSANDGPDSSARAATHVTATPAARSASATG